MAKPAKKKGRREAPAAKPAAKPTAAVEKPVPAKAAAKPAQVASAAGGPLGRMRRFAQQMDRVFEDFRKDWGLFSPGDMPWRGGRESAWLPAVEVLERGGKLVIRAELPGLEQKDVKVEVRDDALAIQGEKRQEREETRKGFYRSERSYGSFYREIPLPEGADPEQAKATFKNGVLEVTLPAPAKRSSGRTVPVET